MTTQRQTPTGGTSYLAALLYAVAIFGQEAVRDSYNRRTGRSFSRSTLNPASV